MFKPVDYNLMAIEEDHMLACRAAQAAKYAMQQEVAAAKIALQRAYDGKMSQRFLDKRIAELALAEELLAEAIKEQKSAWAAQAAAIKEQKKAFAAYLRKQNKIDNSPF